MACEVVNTGQRFVAEMLGQIDCQAQAIGAYGYGALAQPTSVAALVLTALLTIFVALFGLRLIGGSPIAGRDVFDDVLRIGIVLTLATSWPAWRVLGYDLVLKGPAELSRAIGGAAGLPGGAGDLTARLQAADDGIVLLTVYGTGRNTGGTNRSDTIGDSFRGVALQDQQGLANGRIWFLVGVIGPLAIVKLGAGLLLALAPLMAGLLLFAGTRDLFLGWLRALFMVGLGAFALNCVYGVELAVLDPWVRDALALRAQQVLTPSAPTELSVIALSSTAASFGMLLLIARIAFFGGFGIPRLFAIAQRAQRRDDRPVRASTPAADMIAPSRAFVVAEAVSQSIRREQRLSGTVVSGGGPRAASAGAGPASNAGRGTPYAEPLGSSFSDRSARRFRRTSNAGGNRDRRT